MDVWGWFFLVATGLTLANGVIPLRPLFGRHHCLGGEIIAASLAATHLLEWAFDMKSPVAAFAILDLITGAVFFWQAMTKRAAWAASCVIIYFLMELAHVSFILADQGNEIAYHKTLDALFGLALLIINLAIFAGRHVWGERMDFAVNRLLGGWTFSGLSLPRVAHHR